MEKAAETKYIEPERKRKRTTTDSNVHKVIDVWVPLDFGGGYLLVRKLTQCPNLSVEIGMQTHSLKLHEKQTFTILTANETAIILKIVIFKVCTVTSIRGKWPIQADAYPGFISKK